MKWGGDSHVRPDTQNERPPLCMADSCDILSTQKCAKQIEAKLYGNSLNYWKASCAEQTQLKGLSIL